MQICVYYLRYAFSDDLVWKKPHTVQFIWLVWRRMWLKMLLISALLQFGLEIGYRKWHLMSGFKGLWVSPPPSPGFAVHTDNLLILLSQRQGRVQSEGILISFTLPFFRAVLYLIPNQLKKETNSYSYSWFALSVQGFKWQRVCWPCWCTQQKNVIATLLLLYTNKATMTSHANQE